MGFAQELKDFVQAFQAGWQMTSDRQYRQNVMAYNSERTRSLKLENDKLAKGDPERNAFTDGYNRDRPDGQGIPTPKTGAGKAGTKTVDGTGTTMRDFREADEASMRMQNSPMAFDERDTVIRTVLGEAADQGPEGWAAVAHVIKNRTADPRWGGTPAEVAKQPWQFSAWNDASNGGNSLVSKYNPGDRPYDDVGRIVDEVFAGAIDDPTGQAVYYYAPQGMPGGREPSWWDDAIAERGGEYTALGAHRFAGRVGGNSQEGARREMTASERLASYYPDDPRSQPIAQYASGGLVQQVQQAAAIPARPQWQATARGAFNQSASASTGQPQQQQQQQPAQQPVPAQGQPGAIPTDPLQAYRDKVASYQQQIGSHGRSQLAQQFAGEEAARQKWQTEWDAMKQQMASQSNSYDSFRQKLMDSHKADYELFQARKIDPWEYNKRQKERAAQWKNYQAEFEKSYYTPTKPEPGSGHDPWGSDSGYGSGMGGGFGMSEGTGGFSV